MSTRVAVTRTSTETATEDPPASLAAGVAHSARINHSTSFNFELRLTRNRGLVVHGNLLIMNRIQVILRQDCALPLVTTGKQVNGYNSDVNVAREQVRQFL